MLYGKFTSAVERRGYYPAVVQSGNRYAYCGNMPTAYIDRNGLNITLPDFSDNSDPRFTDLQQLTDNILIVDPLSGQVSILSQTDDEHVQRPTGTNLVRELIANPTETRIVVTPYESKHEQEAVFDNKKNLVGTINMVYYNPDQQSEVLTVKNKQAITPGYIALGHELIHSYRALNGLSTRELGWVYPKWRGEVEVPRRDGKTHQHEVEEFKTVGVPYTTELSKYSNDGIDYVDPSNKCINAFTKNKYTENILRLENLLPMRAGYGE